MFFKEALHICHLQNAIIKVLKRLIPRTGSSFFYRRCNRFYINNMITDFCHQLCQNDFIDARETLCSCQVVYRQLFKPLMQTRFLFHIPRHIIKLLDVIAVEPFGNKIITVCLMRHGNKAVQSSKIFLPHSASSRGQQQMNRQSSKIRFFLKKATSLPHHRPERTVRMIFYKILIDRITTQIKPGSEHAAENFIWPRIF